MARQKKVDDADLIDGDKPTTKKRVAKKAAAKADSLKVTNEMVETGGGRPASKETIDQRKKILRVAKNGITNVDLAEKLGVTTAKSQSLAKPLVNKGLLEVERDGTRVLYRTAA